MHPDPLVALWRNTKRPLHGQAWEGLPIDEQARLRALLIGELWDLDRSPLKEAAWAWRHTHRELLELKACSAHTM
jgi:hypothetical protein